ncbi:Uncharacterised protein [Mycobacteroides abscessus]|nr:Uncharacterised protein [Mycobacteroides abscessus]
MRRDDPADAVARGEGLRERAEVEDAVLVEGSQRGERLAVEAEQPVGVVLDDEDAVPLRDLEDARSALGGEGHAGGVVEVRDGVEQLDATPVGGEAREHLLQRLRDEPVLVEGHVHDVGLVRPEHAQRPDVARRLRDDHVARVDEDPRDEVERLLRAGRHDDVVGVALDALEPHDVEDPLAQGLVALTGAVLERRGTARRDEALHGVGDLVEGEAFEVRHAAGERHDLRPVRDREQRSDLRRPHPVRSLCVGTEPRVEAGAAGSGLLRGSRRSSHDPQCGTEDRGIA